MHALYKQVCTKFYIHSNGRNHREPALPEALVVREKFPLTGKDQAGWPQVAKPERKVHAGPDPANPALPVDPLTSATATVACSTCRSLRLERESIG